MLTQERLKELLHYNPATGIFTWRNAPIRSRKPGTIAGTPGTYGYLRIRIDNTLYLNSRLAFLYMKGHFPENEVDHINRKTDDDRWINLREVSHQRNIQNSGNSKNNRSGIKGVHWSKETMKWHAMIKIDGKSYFLGYSSDFLEAACHRLAAEQCLEWANCESSSPARIYMSSKTSTAKPRRQAWSISAQR